MDLSYIERGQPNPTLGARHWPSGILRPERQGASVPLAALSRQGRVDRQRETWNVETGTVMSVRGASVLGVRMADLVPGGVV